MKNTLIILVLSIAAGCSGGEEAATTDVSAQPSTPTVDHIANAIYEGIYDFPIKLQAGLYEGEPYVEDGAARPRVQWIDKLVAFGDLNGDGVDDGAALLAETASGTGSNLYLAAVFMEGLKIKTLPVLIGDRVQVRSLKIADGAIHMEIVEAGPDDAMCCPTQMTAKSWVAKGDALESTRSEIAGRLNVEAFAGTTWRLTHFNIDDDAPIDSPVTLTFAEGKVGGKSGCNQYFASISDHGRGQIKIGEAGATRMACPEIEMELEQQYLKRLQGANKMSFWLGKLALNWTDGEEVGMMLFEAQ